MRVLIESSIDRDSLKNLANLNCKKSSSYWKCPSFSKEIVTATIVNEEKLEFEKLSSEEEKQVRENKKKMRERKRFWLQGKKWLEFLKMPE